MNWVVAKGPNNGLPLEAGIYLDFSPGDSVIINVQPERVIVAGQASQEDCRSLLEKLPDIYTRWTTVERSTNVQEVAKKVELDSQYLAHLIDAASMEIDDDQSVSLSLAG